MTPYQPEGLHPGVLWIRRYARITPGWEALFGSTPTWDDFFSRIRKYPIDQALLLLSQVNGVLSRIDELHGQAGLVNDLFYPDGEEVWSRLQRFEQQAASKGSEEPPFLFHPAQVLMTAKLVLAYQSPDYTQGAESLRPLGEALLMLTDLIHSERAATLDDILPGMVASHLFSFGDVPLHGLGRAFEMYMTDHAELRDHDSYLDLPAELERITGLPPLLLWAMLFATVGKLTTRPAQECGLPFNLNQYLLAPFETQVEPSKSAFTEAEVERLVRLLVANVGEVRSAILKSGFSHETARLYDVGELAVHPLIRHEGKDLCMSDELLFRKLTWGVHHLFLRPDRTTSAQRSRYLRFTGRMFERYADTILQRCLQSQGGHYSGLLPNRNESCCDAVWRMGKALVLFELKAGQFDRDARAGDPERMRRKFDDLVYSPAAQIDSTIRLVKAGQLPEAGEHPSQIAHFYPVAITMEPITMEPTLHEQLLGALTAQGWLTGKDVHSLQIMNVAELEQLEVGLGRGLSLLSILATKLYRPEWRGGGFHNFFLHEFPEQFRGGKNPHLERTVEDLFARAIALIRKRTET